MGEIVVHGMIGSPFVRSALVALAEKGQAYRLRPLRIQEIRSPEFQALHPFRRVPVFEQDGFTLCETQAILRHIERAWPEPALIPIDIAAAARMDEALGIVDNYLFPGGGEVLGYQRIIAPRFLKIAPNEEACAAAESKVGTVLGMLARTLGEKPYLTGSAPTLADLAFGCHLDFLRTTPEGARTVAGEPALDALRLRLGERPSFRDTTIPELARRFLPPKTR